MVSFGFKRGCSSPVSAPHFKPANQMKSKRIIIFITSVAEFRDCRFRSEPNSIFAQSVVCRAPGNFVLDQGIYFWTETILSEFRLPDHTAKFPDHPTPATLGALHANSIKFTEFITFSFSTNKLTHLIF